MPGYLDNPTLTFEEWCAKRSIKPTDPRARKAYATYKASNDKALEQMGLFRGVWQADTEEGRRLALTYGPQLAAACGKIKIKYYRHWIHYTHDLCHYTNEAISKGWVPPDGDPVNPTHVNGGEPLFLTANRGYYNELKAWRDYFRWAEANGIDQVKKQKAEWTRVCTPIINAVITAEGQRTGGTLAKIVERTPLWSKGARMEIAARGQANPTLSESIQQSLGIGKYDPRLGSSGITPPKAGPSGAAAAPAATSWATYLVIGAIVLGLAVAAYFIFKD